MLFAGLDQTIVEMAGTPVPEAVAWAPSARGSTALVVELEGARALTVGWGLAAAGYRPVPLFNTSHGRQAVVNVLPALLLLRPGAEVLLQTPLPDDAPPAFLIDAGRNPRGARPRPRDYDNRWVVFPQDFPSANFLRAAGIEEVVLVSLATAPAEDLAHVLLRWQMAGLRIALLNPDTAHAQAEPIEVRRPSLFRQIWARALVMAGLRRNAAGGFGGMVPEPSSHG